MRGKLHIRILSIVKEGMTIKDGYFYFVPEDFPKTRLYRIKIKQQSRIYCSRQRLQ